MSHALCNFGKKNKKRGVRDDTRSHKVHMNLNLKIVRLGIARTHGWVELALRVPTSLSHRSSTVCHFKMTGRPCTDEVLVKVPSFQKVTLFSVL